MRAGNPKDTFQVRVSVSVSVRVRVRVRVSVRVRVRIRVVDGVWVNILFTYHKQCVPAPSPGIRPSRTDGCWRGCRGVRGR